MEDKMTEAKVKVDKEALASELEELKADYEDFGVEGFYEVPFETFQKEFPVFTKECIIKYLTNMEILTPEEVEDEDLMYEYWQTGELIIPDDWEALFKGAEHIINDVKPQWDRLWKTQYTKLVKGDTYGED